MQQGERQRKRDALREHVVQAEPVAAADLKERTQRQHAEDDRGPGPRLQAAAPRPRAQQRQRQCDVAEKDRVDIAETALAFFDGPERGRPMLARRYARRCDGCGDRVEIGRRDQPDQVGAELDALAPPGQRVVAGQKLTRDGNEHRRPDQPGNRHRQGQPTQRVPAQPPLPPNCQHNDRGEERQERCEDHLRQRSHCEEKARQHGVFQFRLAQRFQQVKRVERQPLRRDHVIVAQRGVDRPVRREGVDQTGEESGEVERDA